MIKYQGPDSDIHVIVRAILVNGENIILCHSKGSKSFFLPGGHLENGETAKGALLRELAEEIGPADYKIKSFIGACENIFPIHNNALQHEMNLVFEVAYPVNLEISSKEDHLEFLKINKKDLADYNILSAPFKEGIIEWLKDGKTFFKEIE